MPTNQLQPDNPCFFRFDLDTAIRDQLLRKLDQVSPVPLYPNSAPSESGIYVLYYKNTQVYVGKASKETTKSSRTLRTRLGEHINKISTRRNISLNDMQVKFVTFESEWWVFAAEYVLIAYFNPAWNFSGFGSKVPGVGRPGTARISTWNEQFPLREGGTAKKPVTKKRGNIKKNPS